MKDILGYRNGDARRGQVKEDFEDKNKELFAMDPRADRKPV